MRRKSNNQWPCCRPKGLTLIEVVASLAILGTLLVAVLLAEARCRRQSAGANARLAACREAESLLETWWADLEKFPRNGQGEVENQREFFWRTSTLGNQEVEKLGGRVVRLEIFSRLGASREKPVVTVDVVLPSQHESSDRDGLHAD